MVFWRAKPFVKQRGEIEDCFSQALGRGLLIPNLGRGIILCDPHTTIIGNAKLELGAGGAPVCCRTQVPQRLLAIRRANFSAPQDMRQN